VAILTGTQYGFNCPKALAFDGTNIWVGNYNGNSITIFNAGTNSVYKILTGSGIAGPSIITFTGTNIWVGNTSQSLANSLSLFNLDGTNTKIILAGTVFGSPSCISPAGAYVWISDSSGSQSFKYGAENGTLVLKTQLGLTNGISCVGYHSGVVWMASGDTSQVLEYNATSGARIRNISVGGPTNLIFNGNILLVESSSSSPDSIIEYNSEGKLIKIVYRSDHNQLKGISSMFLDGNNLWTTNPTDNTVSVHTV
jgi:hypothetical protein